MGVYNVHPLAYLDFTSNQEAILEFIGTREPNPSLQVPKSLVLKFMGTQQAELWVNGHLGVLQPSHNPFTQSRLTSLINPGLA